jgi:hypothetical protein
MAKPTGPATDPAPRNLRRDESPHSEAEIAEQEIAKAGPNRQRCPGRGPSEATLPLGVRRSDSREPPQPNCHPPATSRYFNILQNSRRFHEKI